MLKKIAIVNTGQYPRYTTIYSVAFSDGEWGLVIGDWGLVIGDWEDK
jgi:hypothetical protein